MLLKDMAKELLTEYAAKKNSGPVDKLSYHIFNNICDAFGGKRKNCWTSSIAPFELISIFDMMNLPIELVISQLARVGKATGLIDLGAEITGSREICTCMRGVTGGIMTDQYPRPDALMRSSHFCVGADKFFDIAEARYNVPYYMVNVPINDVPDALDYVARQFEDIFNKLEKRFGVEITQSKIEAVFANINRTYENFRKIGELMMTRPMPATEDVYANPWMFTFLLGQKEAVEISQDMINIIQDNIDNNKHPVPDEKYRIMLTGGVPWIPNPIMDWIRAYDGVAVFKNMDYFAPFAHYGIEPLDASDPFTSLAKLMVNNILETRDADLGAEGHYQFLKMNGIDGMIMVAPWACMIGGGSMPSMKNFMSRKDMPYLEFDLDCYDKRSFDREFVKKKIDLFMKTIIH